MAAEEAPEARDIRPGTSIPGPAMAVSPTIAEGKRKLQRVEECLQKHMDREDHRVKQARSKLQLDARCREVVAFAPEAPLPPREAADAARARCRRINQAPLIAFYVLCALG
jgi:hypothetical protein